MKTSITFSDEIANLLFASTRNPLRTCIQCGTCSGTCPVAGFMDQSPRKIIHISGRSYEPIMATVYIFNSGLKELFHEAQMAPGLVLKGRLPVLLPRIKN